MEERVLSKAEAAWQSIKKPLLVDDTGVFFEAVPGFPGAKPRRVFETMGFEGLLKKLDGKSRKAYFLTLICFMNGSGPMLFEGRMGGSISEKIYLASRPGLPYEQIFIPDGYDIPVSQLSLEEKSKISHRAEAARKLAPFILRKSLQ